MNALNVATSTPVTVINWLFTKLPNLKKVEVATDSETFQQFLNTVPAGHKQLIELVNR